MAFVGNTNYNFSSDQDKKVGSRPHRSSSRSFYRGQQAVQEEEETPFESQAERDARITNLARTISSSYRQDGRPRDPDEMTLVDNSDPVLDPHSDKFNAKKWVKHTMNEISKREGANVIRKGGAAWRNLTAIGEASGSSYQLTVGNAIPSFFASLFSKLRGHAETVDILKSFDGYLESGEMLVVLGPPGRYVLSGNVEYLNGQTDFSPTVAAPPFSRPSLARHTAFKSAKMRISTITVSLGVSSQKSVSDGLFARN